MKSEIRKDYIQEKYVIIAPRRGKRPHELKKQLEDKRRGKSDSCDFCPTIVNKVDDLLTIGPRNNWKVKVIRNIFPAVTYENPRAYGTQEVVIDTPDHALELEDLSVESISELLRAYAIRTEELSKDNNIEYIIIFKNNGGRAGASIKHAHSQIFATKFLPPHLIDKSQRQQAYKLHNGTCVYCDVVKKEAKGSRLVYQDKNVIAFCPWASIYNYEVWILPKRHIDNITQLTKPERLSWAKILKRILKKIGKLGLPYNFYFHQVINDEDQHLYMKIVPRGSVWAGIEIGSGLVINPIPPEVAAPYYKK